MGNVLHNWYCTKHTDHLKKQGYDNNNNNNILFYEGKPTNFPEALRLHNRGYDIHAQYKI